MSVTRARIWLCADDYGISPSVNAAIRDLIAHGRINATSVMVAAPSFQQSEAMTLDALNTGTRRVTIGLHVTLTAPFRPLSAGFERTYSDQFLPLLPALVLAIMRRFRRAQLVAEITAQFDAFVTAFGRAPDFVDGHQHVQLFPQIRDAFLTVAKAKAPLAWVRQCGRIVPLTKRLADIKGLLLDVLSRGFRIHAARLAVRTNAAFAGTYDFEPGSDYAKLFPTFLADLPDNSVVMCHPGIVDDELKRLDPLTTLREREYAYFADERFPAVLEMQGVALA
jgi:chitin disaccharide deacetylase